MHRIAVAAAAAVMGTCAADAATLVPVPHVFADGSSLVSVAGEGLSPDRYDPWHGAKVRPALPWSPSADWSAPLPCRAVEDARGRAEYERPENFIFCGWPAASPQAPRAAAPSLPWAGGGDGCRSCGGPSPVAPVPLPAAGWLLVGGLAAFAGLRRRAKR